MVAIETQRYTSISLGFKRQWVAEDRSHAHMAPHGHDGEQQLTTSPWGNSVKLYLTAYAVEGRRGGAGRGILFTGREMAQMLRELVADEEKMRWLEEG